MVAQQTYLSVSQALNELLQAFEPLPAEGVRLEEALDRVLAEEIIATSDLPPFDNSAMDGYAVRAEDLEQASKKNPVSLAVIGDVPAGAARLPAIRPGSAVRIMTGAPLPPGADAVVPVEHTTAPEPMAGRPVTDWVTILDTTTSGNHVRHAGHDLRAGERVLPAGHRLRPPDIGILAALGISRPMVHRRPRVAVISTGDELVDLDDEMHPGQVRDSNSFAIAAAVRALGAEALRIGRAGDSQQEIVAKLDTAVRAGVNVILSTAGVSMGALDNVRSAVRARGELTFWKVNMRPGKPVAFGRYQGVPFVGLPGNPVSALVAFEVLVRPAILRLSGHRLAERETLLATLRDGISSDGRESYLRARVVWTDRGLEARSVRSQDSSALSSLVEANALMILPAGVRAARKGERVRVWLLGAPPSVPTLTEHGRDPRGEG